MRRRSCPRRTHALPPVPARRLHQSRHIGAVHSRVGKSLARDADVAPNTARNRLSVLEASGLVYLLQPYL